MQNKQGNYEKVLLTLSAIVGIGVSGFFIYDSQSLADSLIEGQGSSKNVLNPPPTEVVQQAIKRLTEKVIWVGKEIDGKPVPLNKSIILLKKGDDIIDMQRPEPALRPPMTNEFLLKYKLDNIEYANVGELDPDNDGFTTLEEFQANPQTNPMDSASHPPVVQKLFLVQRISHDYKIMLNSGGTAPYQVKRSFPEPAGSKFVTPGEEFGFDKGVNRFKALGYEAKTVKDERLGEKDASELKCLDTATNKEFVLVYKVETNLATYSAEFEFRIGTTEKRTVREGETFQIPGIGQTFKVLKIEEDKAEVVPWDGNAAAGPAFIVPKG